MIHRPATPLDDLAIAALHRAAFAGDDEARLVAGLTADGDALLSMVAQDDGVVAGHVMFSPMQVTADGAVISAASLAPVSVWPPLQGRGIGSSLIRIGLEALATRAVRIVFVLGDPRYYGRFGFETGVAAAFASPYAGSHVMARWLGDPMTIGSGSASHAPAFNRMSATA